MAVEVLIRQGKDMARATIVDACQAPSEGRICRPIGLI